MKSYTTSAQKTVSLPADKTLEKLQAEIGNAEGVVFKATNNKNIREAKMKDGSTLAIASFIKENGATLAMIDHKKVSEKTERSAVQKKWRNTLDALFK